LLWGEVVGDEIAMLAGPIEGTWVWGDGKDLVDIPPEGTEIPVTAYIEFDPSSYLLIDTKAIPGSYKVFQDRMTLCPIGGFRAEGVMTFVDQNGETVAVAPLILERRSEPEYYISSMELEGDDIAIFSAELTPLAEGGTHQLWGLVYHGLFTHAEFDYTVEYKLPNTPDGHEAALGAFVEVATFYVD
jgi:hypothetical protein